MAYLQSVKPAGGCVRLSLSTALENKKQLLYAVVTFTVVC